MVYETSQATQSRRKVHYFIYLVVVCPLKISLLGSCLKVRERRARQWSRSLESLLLEVHLRLFFLLLALRYTIQF